MDRRIASIFQAVLLAVYSCNLCSASNRSQIFRDINNVRDPDVAPFESTKTSITVEVDIALLGIFEVNEKQKIMSGSYAMFVSWKDDRMMWDPSSYQNISSVQVKAKKIWMPTSLCILNEIGNENCISDDKGIVTVYSGGYVTNKLFKENTVRCGIDVTKYLFDSQTCYLQFININVGTEYLTFEEEDSHFYPQNYEKTPEVSNIVATTESICEIGNPTGIPEVLTFRMVLQG